MDIESILTPEEKIAIIHERLFQLKKDAYNIELNRKFAVKEGNEEAIEKFTTAVAALLSSIELHEDILASLETGVDLAATLAN